MTDFVNDSAETLAFAEAVAERFGKNVDEAVEFNSFYPATPYYTGSDLGIYNAVMTDAQVREFIQNRSPLGYSPYRDFVAGDYQFRRAYIDFVFVPVDGADAQLSLTAATFIADVPDKVETNTATITVAASGISVTFTKGFIAAPNVILTPVGSAARNAVLTANPTATGFTAKLYDNTGTAVTGTFFWTATGY